MNGNSENSGRREIFKSAIIISIALVLCALIFRGTFVKIKSLGQVVSVTGSAIMPIKSDYGILELVFEAKSNDITKAYSKMKQDLEIIKEFLKNKGIIEGQYEIGIITKNDEYDNNGKYIQTRLTQIITIQNNEVEKIKMLGVEATKLSEKNIEINATLKYLYTKIEEVKIEMLKKATENAKLRALQIASTTGRRVGMAVSAEAGVFQIRPKYSQEISDYGINDITSIDKEIVVTVRVKFLLE